MSEAGHFDGKVALITGGTRVIGLAAAERLASECAAVALNFVSRTSEAEAAVKKIEESGGKAISVQGDVSCADSAQSIVEQTREQLGPIDILIHSAGISIPMHATEVTHDIWSKTISINLDGTFNMVYAVKDEMLQRKFGRIVVLSSIAGLRERENQMPYCVSKAGVIAMTRSCAEAWGPSNVRFNCVAPGLTETEMAHTLSPEVHADIISHTPLRRIGQPHEIANLIRFLVSEESSYMTGQTVVSSGGRVMIP